MKSGVIGSHDQSTEERALYSDGIAGQDTTADSNLGRNTALAGAGAATGAGGAYAATRSGQDSQEPTHTDRSFPLRGGAVAGQEDNRPTSSVYSAEGAGPTSSGATDPSGGTGLYRGTAGGTGADSGKAALTNLGLAQHYDTDHKGHSHAFQGDPCETSPTVEKTLSNIPGPHATVAANMLDPHVPGEFPTEDGIDPHNSHGAAGFGSAAQQSSSRSTSGPAVGGFGVQPESSTDDHHHDDATLRSTDPYDTYKDAADPRVQPETTSSTGGITSSQGVTPNAASATSTTGRLNLLNS